MPGTPMNQGDDGLEKLQTDSPRNEQRVVEGEVEYHQRQQQQYNPDPSSREVTQTDQLNKRLLESLLKRMSKADGEFDKFMEDEEVEEEKENLDEENGHF